MRTSLATTLSNRAFDRMAAPALPNDEESVYAVVEQIDREFMVGPPLTLHLQVPTLFAATWAALRESALAGPTDRATREIIAASVSRLNECPFCVDSHTASTSALGEDGAAKAVRAGSIDSIRRADLRAAARWAAATRSPGDAVLSDPPFTRADEPYAIGTALAFHHINRMVSTFLKPWPIKVPAFLNRRGLMTRINAVFPGRLLGVRNLEPGTSLAFCGEASPVAELAKLNRAPEVGRAWGAFIVAAENGGVATLSDACRSVVGDAIGRWDGADPPLGKLWREEIGSALPPAERPLAAFALTCGLAPYRVDDALVGAVRAIRPSDAAVVSIAAWASGRAVRRIASWL